MVDHPSEFGAYILIRAEEARIYFSTQNRVGLRSSPAMMEVDALIEKDLATGWQLQGHLHNHPFDFNHPVHFMGGPSPSISDVEAYQDRIARWGLKQAWVTNGFHTIELEARDLERL